MRILCLAYQLVGHMGLSYFLDETDDEVVAVFTHEDSPGEEIWWPSVAEKARAAGVPVHTTENLSDPATVQQIRDLEPAFIFSFYYRNMVGREILGIPPGGALNLHGSLLPSYRGRAPVNWVLVNGETRTGMTLHYMVEKADAGDIVGQAFIPIESRDTAMDLYRKMAPAGLDVLRAAWPLLREGKAPRVVQDTAWASYYGRRGPEDGRFEWDWPCQRIDNLVRAVTHPYPGAFVSCRGKKLLLWDVLPVPGRLLPDPPPPGSIVTCCDEGFQVATGEGGLLVRRIQLEGEEELSGVHFAERHGLKPGDLLGTA